MVSTNQNIIHRSAFNFEYGSKASASRCNILIESIFNSYILPELEKAISNHIPDGVLVELAKLEINFGRIDEKEISTNLADKISKALENALRSIPQKNSLSGNGYSVGVPSGNYLIEWIELFLQKGFFPFGIEDSFSIDDLVTRTIRRHQKEFIESIKKFGDNDSAIKRIAFSLSAETFDLIVFAIASADSQWIFDFREILISAKKERNISRISGDEFLRTVNYFILKYLLNETGPVFDRKKFSGSILKKFLLVFSEDSEVLRQALKKNTGNSSTIILINETLSKLLEDKNISLPAEISQSLDIDRLIQILNSGSDKIKSFKLQFLKNKIIEVIHDQARREILIEKLNKNGVKSILDLFDHNKTDLLIRLIMCFAAKIAGIKSAGISVKKALSVNQFVLQTVLYLNEKAVRNLDHEEFVLFLIYTAGLEDSETVNSPAFEDFVRKQKNVDLKRMHFLISNERQYPEISSIQKLISKSQNQAEIANASQPKSENADEYFAIYRRKIVGYYLNSGQLPDAFSDLNKSDVQRLFRDLIQQKDDFLAAQFRRIEDPEGLINRLRLLTRNEELEEYLIHFFPEEYAILSKRIAEINHHFTLGAESPIISSTVFRNELFIKALAESKGGSLSDVFLFSILENLNAELTFDYSDSDKLMHFLSSKSGSSQKTGNLPNKVKSDEEYKKMIHRGYNILASRLQLAGLEIQISGEEIHRLIKKFAFHFLVDESAFLDFLQENRNNLLQIYSLLKFYLPSGQWKSIEKSLLSRIELKTEIERIQQHSDIIIRKLAVPDKVASATTKEFKDMAELWQVSKNSELSEKVIDETDNPNPSKELNRYFSILKFYGQNGFFPWWAGEFSMPELIGGLHKSSQLYPKTFEQLFLRWENDEHIFDRLIPKLPQSLINEFDQFISAHLPLNGVWKKIIQENRKIAKSNSEAETDQFSGHSDSLFKDQYFSEYQEIVNQWFKDPEVATQIKEYLLLSPYFYFRNINPAQWRQAVYEFSRDFYISDTRKASNQFHRDFLKYLKKKYPGTNWSDTFTTVHRLVQSSEENDHVAVPPAMIQELKIQPENPKKGNDTGFKESEILSEEDHGIEVRISNSGLILFWPFLTRLFENLSLVKNGAFINQESMNRAVYILQYLAYFEIDFPEYKLVLNKLLVGMPSQDHLVPFVKLTAEEKELAHSLFNGLIQNWEKVKNSSPEGIQQTFIQREGILKFQKDKISLVLEKKGFDVLLESIPWNISLIKLSWMKKPIYVEWI